MALSFSEAIEQLESPLSPRRRAAAKRLQELQDVAAGPALLAALRREVTKRRTWETQYQIIMALGVCGYVSALPLLNSIATTGNLAAPSAYTGLGDAIVRLGRKFDDDASPICWCLELGNDFLLDGAFRAMAMLRMIPDDDEIGRIIDFVQRRDPNDMLRFWPVVAAAGWRGEVVHGFLVECAAGPRRDTAEAATSALSGEYGHYRVL